MPQDEEQPPLRCKKRTVRQSLCGSAKVTSVLAEHLLKSLQQMGRFIFPALLFVTGWEHRTVYPHESEV